MAITQAEARRQVRASIGETTGQPYDQGSKVARFAAWVTVFGELFPTPYQQISNHLETHPVSDWQELQRALHSVMNDITGGGPRRSDPNQFDLWAGGLTAAVHTTSIVRSAERVGRQFGLDEAPSVVSMRMVPTLTTLIMEHQDRLGDIKIGLSMPIDETTGGMGNYSIDPTLLELMKNGKIKFIRNSLDELPILPERQVGPSEPDGSYLPAPGEEVIGDITPRTVQIGCPISFITGFGEALLQATVDTAVKNELIR